MTACGAVAKSKASNSASKSLSNGSQALQTITHKYPIGYNKVLEVCWLRRGAIKKYRHAIVKFNGGRGALLCNQCSVIIDYGFNHKDVEHYCSKCEDDDGQRKQAETNKQRGI